MMRTLMIGVIAAVMCGGCAGRQREASLIGPLGPVTVTWSDAEMAKPYAVQEVFRTEQASHHVVRLAVAEKPHVHDSHDGTVFVLAGRARVHLGDEVYEVRKGDTLFIPHGLVHWAENIGDKPALAYVVFAPPFDGKDIRPVKP